MKQRHPDIASKFDVVKPALTPENKATRLEKAREMIKKSMAWLQSIIFIDEAGVEEKPTPRRVVARKGQEVLRQTKRLHPNKYRYEQIRFTLAVNAKMGFVGCQVYSTTKGAKSKQRFYVSGAGGQCAHLIRAGSAPPSHGLSCTIAGGGAAAAWLQQQPFGLLLPKTLGRCNASALA